MTKQPRFVSKSIDLIVANVMHDAVEMVSELDTIIRVAKKMEPDIATTCEIPDIPVEVARRLLCRIAHDANQDVVFTALKAIGAPSGPDAINDGMQAVRDRQ
jgi:hypothetical protein